MHQVVPQKGLFREQSSGHSLSTSIVAVRRKAKLPLQGPATREDLYREEVQGVAMLSSYLAEPTGTSEWDLFREQRVGHSLSTSIVAAWRKAKLPLLQEKMRCLCCGVGKEEKICLASLMS